MGEAASHRSVVTRSLCPFSFSRQQSEQFSGPLFFAVLNKRLQQILKQSRFQGNTVGATGTARVTPCGTGEECGTHAVPFRLSKSGALESCLVDSYCS